MINKTVTLSSIRTFYPHFLENTKLFTCVVCMLLTGCFSSSQVSHFPPQSVTLEDAQKARIYLGSRSCFLPKDISVNGEHIGSISAKNYICWEVPPGKYTISAPLNIGSTSYILTTQAGKVYYLDLYWKLLGFKKYYIRLLDDVKGKVFIEGLTPPSE
jgi:Protein of unknown function (DUF2846)